MLAKAAINPLKDFLVRAKSAFVLDRGLGVSDFELRRLGGRPGTCRGGLGSARSLRLSRMLGSPGGRKREVQAAGESGWARACRGEIRRGLGGRAQTGASEARERLFNQKPVLNMANGLK